MTCWLPLEPEGAHDVDEYYQRESYCPYHGLALVVYV